METLAKFLTQKGALDLLFQLEAKPKGFNELKLDMHGSPNTLLARIKEATKLGLIEESLVRTNHRSLIKYTLTKEGRKELNSFGPIKGRYEKLKELLKEQENKKSNTEREINELLSSITKTRVNTSISNNKISKSKNVNIKIENKT